MLTSFFALHSRISHFEIEKKVKFSDAPRWGETGPSIGSVCDIVFKQVIRMEPSDAPILPGRNLGEDQGTHTTLSQFESDSMADKEIPTFLYDMSREQAGGQLSVHNKPCPAINHHSGEKPDLTSHEKNAEKKESASTPMAQPEVRESF